ncbi:ABC transporter ATP-binding protein [Flammeovirgaceae bacterium SG7u.111]|nr:ABC transporter ATP-binding protein [Flammeovirgaceae bacterium SG7u.132]WPO35322.1 ABC transporter ATP-binding protein [Flammeovirgaceae bacterium SG7u.111]
MKELAYLNKYFLKYKFRLLLGVACVTLANIFAIFPAQMVRYAFDLVNETLQVYPMFEGSGFQQEFYEEFGYIVLFYGILIVVMAFIRGGFLFLMRQTIIVVSRYVEYDLKNEIFNHYQALSMSFYKRNNTGDLMARISEDVSRVRMYLGPAVMYGINLTVTCVLVIGYMLTVNVKLTLYALAPLPILSISIYYVNTLINKRSEAIQEGLSDMSTFVQEAFSGIRVLKAFAREADSLHNFEKESDDYKVKSLRLAMVNALFFPLMLGLIGLSTILTVYVGGVEVINGAITPGNIAEFIIYVNLLTWPVTALGWVTSIIQRAAASQKRINEFLNTPNDIVSEKNLQKDVQGRIKFENVSFDYPDSGIKALKNVSFEVENGETLAVLGTTGSGKSTIANLLCRLYDTTGGEIYVDETPIAEYNINKLRSHIGYVPQDVFLFSDTIENNIAFGANDLKSEDIMKAVKDADLYNSIESFNKGLETMVGERGITLSGGQKQRVSIARAIVRKPEILILDDCLSAVDTKTENAILNNLKSIMEARTSIIISHRVSSAKLADKIIVLDGGEVKETGTHEELMMRNGTYKELYDKQLQTEEEQGA